MTTDPTGDRTTADTTPEHLDLVRSVALAANTAWRPEDALGLALEVSCRCFDWPAGMMWRVDDHELVLVERFSDGSARAEGFVAAIGTAMPLGDGSHRTPLAALVATRSPAAAWLLDAETTATSLAAQAHGLRSTVAFAVLVDDDPTFVMQAFSASRDRPSRATLAALETVALQLSRVVERDLASRRLESSHWRLEQVIHTARDAYLSLDTEGRILAWNRQAERLFGWSAEEVIGRPMTATIVAPREHERFRDELARFRSGTDPTAMDRVIDTWARHRDGHDIPVEVTIWPLRIDGGDPQINNLIRDRRSAPGADDIDPALGWRVLGLAALGLFRWSVGDDEISFAPGTLRYLNVARPDFAPTTAQIVELIHPDDREAFAEATRQVLAGQAPMTVEARIARPGPVRSIRCHLAPDTDPDGTVRGIWGTIADITEEQRARDALTLAARRDPATGLANRLGLEEALGTWLGRGSVVTLALADACTARVGAHDDDEASNEILATLAEGMRRSLPEPFVLGHLRPGEFAVAIDADRPDLPGLIQQALEAAAPPNMEPRMSTACVGAAKAEVDSTFDDLLRDAAIALRVARSRGQGSVEWFHPDLQASILAELSFRADLDVAVERGQLELHYQPIVALPSGKVAGLEALLRWRRPDVGLVPPGRFIAEAERSGAILEFGRWALREACRQLAAWQGHLSGAEVYVSVNLSPNQMTDPGLVATVLEAVSDAGLAPSQLVLELTESALVANPATAVARLWELRRAGVRIAMDDFGTGYSSLSRLRRFPLDLIKLDRSFIREVRRPGDDPPILGALLSLAARMRVGLVVEGVETPAQLAAAVAYGCDAAQGFLLSRPLAAAQLARLLDDPAWDPTVDADPSAAAVSPPADAETLLDELLDASGWDAAYVTRIDFEAARQLVLSSRSRGDLKIPTDPIDWSRSHCRQALLEGRQLIAPAPDGLPAGIRTYLGVPIGDDEGDLLGTLCVVSGRRVEPRVGLLRRMARMASSLAPEVARA